MYLNNTAGSHKIYIFFKLSFILYVWLPETGRTEPNLIRGRTFISLMSYVNVNWSNWLICGCTFVLRQVSLIDGFFDLVVGSFRVQIHGPAEVHQSQVGLTQLLIHLRVRCGVLLVLQVNYVMLRENLWSERCSNRHTTLTGPLTRVVGCRVCLYTNAWFCSRVSGSTALFVICALVSLQLQRSHLIGQNQLLPFLWGSKPKTLWERSASVPPTPEELPAERGRQVVMETGSEEIIKDSILSGSCRSTTQPV